MSNFTFSYRSEDDEGAPSSMSMSFSARNAGEIEQAFRNFLNVCGYHLPDEDPELELVYRVPDPSEWDWDDDDEPASEIPNDTALASYCDQHPDEPECRIYEL